MDSECLLGLLLKKFQHQVEDCGDEEKLRVDLLKAVKCYHEQMQQAKEAPAARTMEAAMAEAASAKKLDEDERKERLGQEGEEGLDEEQRNVRAKTLASARVAPYQTEQDGVHVFLAQRGPLALPLSHELAGRGLWCQGGKI